MAFGIDDAVAAGLKVLDKFVPDPEAKAKAESELRQSLMEWDKMQASINEKEAENTNLFVSGWRPAIGWIGAIALGMHYLFPFFAWISFTFFHNTLPQPPKLDESLWQLIFGLLGFGGMRSWEKSKGLSK